MSMGIVHFGHIIHLTGRPGLGEAAHALREHRDGALVVDGHGRITACGPADQVPLPEGGLLVRHRGGIILPGFVDAHLHFPQIDVQHAFGGAELLSWLERHVFPAEARFSDPAYARGAARAFCDALIRAGTTTALIFGSQFPAAQASLFEELARRGLRGITGRTVMVRGPAAAAALVTTEAEALRLGREEIARWHPREGRAARALVQVAIVPRFTPSMTPSALRAFAELHQEHRELGVYFTSHLAEDASPGGEIELTLRELRLSRHLDAFDGGVDGAPSILGARSVFAHAVHCGPGELSRLRETGSGIAHCPTSQLFLGHGTLPWRTVRASGVDLAAGTDVAAGGTFSIPEVLDAAYKVHRSAPAAERQALHPTELLHLATVGGARVLDLEDCIGNLDPGKDADFLVVDPSDDPLLLRRLEAIAAMPAEEASAQRLFAILMSLRRLIPRAVFVRGRQIGPP